MASVALGGWGIGAERNQADDTQPHRRDIEDEVDCGSPGVAFDRGPDMQRPDQGQCHSARECRLLQPRCRISRHHLRRD